MRKFLQVGFYERQKKIRKKIIKSVKKIVKLNNVKKLVQKTKPQLIVAKAHTHQKTRQLTVKSYLWVRKNKLFSRTVLLPWFLAAFYIVVMQTPQYESTASLLIEKDEDKSAMNISLGILGKDSTSKSTNTYLTQEFVTSRELMNTLQTRMNIKGHYQAKEVDFLSRLKKNPTQKEFLAYYQKKISTVVDPVTNELNLSVRAFSPEEAQRLLQEIIQQSKHFVNRVSNIMAEKQYQFADAQLQAAKDKLFQAEKETLKFQNLNGTYNPRHTAEVVASVVGQLKARLVEKQTELITYSSYMQSSSSKIIALKEEIKAIKEQMQNQTNDLLSNQKDGAKLNRLLVDYEWQELQLKFAQAEYQASQQAYDLANLNLAKQQNLVIEISPPNLPDMYEYPKILYNLANIFALLMIFFVLTKMAILIIQEHTY